MGIIIFGMIIDVDDGKGVGGGIGGEGKLGTGEGGEGSQGVFEKKNGIQ